MSKTNWKKLADKTYLGAWDIEDGDLILTIASVTQEKVQNPQGKDDLCIVARWQENDYKPMILNATNCKVIEKICATPYIEDWVGHKVALFKTNITAFGDTTECVRIRPYAPRVVEKPKHYCECCGCEITGANGLDADSVAAYTFKKYGKELCSVCASKVKNGGNE